MERQGEVILTTSVDRVVMTVFRKIHLLGIYLRYQVSTAAPSLIEPVWDALEPKQVFTRNLFTQDRLGCRMPLTPVFGRQRQADLCV